MGGMMAQAKNSVLARKRKNERAKTGCPACFFAYTQQKPVTR
jgi:hypothetical protein